MGIADLLRASRTLVGEVIAGRIGAGPILPEDLPLWQGARTIQDLADLTARWLAGEIQSQPGYHGPVDVDEDYATGLTKTLILLNRAGYLTDNSQAGAEGIRWTQRASVCGFADDNIYRRLRDAVDGTRFEILAGHCERNGPRVAVSFQEGRPFTRFGVNSEPGVRFSYEDCGAEVVAALVDAWQVTVYDPVVASNDLWPHLASAAEAW